jgi:hypothetical protein
MSDEQTGGEKKIFIDEDWKSQVQAEKEANISGKEEPTNAQHDDQGPLPPPTLTFLASTMYLQGAIAMGLLPNPVSDQPSVNISHAKHAIDMLAMLQAKTEGNRTKEESDEIEAMLHQLRMAFVSLSQK